MKTLLLSGLLASAMVLTTAPAANAQEIGVNAAVKNDVGITPGAVEDAPESPAKIGGDVALRDVIRSGDNSALQVLLLDETTFTVGANAQLTVDTFVYDPERGAGKVAGSVAKGAFRLISGKSSKDKDVSVETPVASIGVRGTIVEGAVGRDAIAALAGLTGQFSDGSLTEGATLIVLRGPERDHNNLNRPGVIHVISAAGQRITLSKSNAAVIVPGGGAPIIGPFTLPQATVRSFGQTLGTVPTPIGNEAYPEVAFLPIPSLDGAGPDDIFFVPEDDTVIDRPFQLCFLLGEDDGIPSTDGGLELDGSPTDAFDDFGSFEGGDCIE